jgi:hypothetical protein
MSKTIKSDDDKRKASYWADKNGNGTWAKHVAFHRYLKRMPASRRNQPDAYL